MLRFRINKKHHFFLLLCMGGISHICKEGERNDAYCYENTIQWNLPKADTCGTTTFVRFREVSALERFDLNFSLDESTEQEDTA